MNNNESEERRQSLKQIGHEENQSPTDEPKHRKQKLSAIKNQLILCLSFLLFFLGFWGLTNLQSTMNAEDDIGVDSQAVIYATSMLSSVLLPDLLIKKIGSKWVFVLSIAVSCMYIAANFRIQRGTMMAGAVVNGIASGPLNAAQSYYVDEMAVRFKTSESESMENIMAGFFALFMFSSESAQLWGNLISFYILRYDHGAHPVTQNVTYDHCGINFKYGDVSDNTTNPNLIPPSEEKRYILVGSFLLCGVLAALISTFLLPSLGNDIVKNDDEKWWKTTCDRLTAALKLNTNPQQMLLVFITMYCGMHNAFYASEFTKAYIACPLGIDHVGRISMFFGVCGCLTALLLWPLIKITSQMFVMLAVSCVNIGVFVSLFLWKPQPGSLNIYAVYAGIFGMGDAIWGSQIPGLHRMSSGDHVGKISVFYGVCGCLTFLLLWPLVKISSHMVVLLAIFCVDISVGPPTWSLTVFAVYAGIFGMSDAIWSTLTIAVYGITFPNQREAASSNFYFWNSVGFFISYTSANSINASAKLTILLVLLILGILG